MIHTQTEIDNLVELAIIQRAELKKLVESLPQLRDHLSSEIERNLEEIEPAIRSELEQFVTARALDAHAQTSTALTAKIDELARSLETTTAARYSVLIAEREKNESLLAQAEARIAEAASALPGSVKEIVAGELARFPRAGEIDQLRKEFAEPKGLNPRGKWSPDETYQRLDLVTFNGDSFVSNIDGNRERPSRSAADWTLNAARGNSGGGGSVTSIIDLIPAPSAGQILGSVGPNYVPKNLVAGANITISETDTDITIVGTEGQIELTDGTEAAPSLFFVSDTNTGMYRPAADTVGIVGGGHDILRLTDVASATDYLEVKNGIGVGTPLHVLAEGASANIGVHLQPKGSGLFTISDGTDFNKGIRFRSSSSAASAVTLIDAVSTAGRVVTLPDATDTLVGRSTTDTLSNKTMIAPDLGTPSALVGTNITGTAAGLTAGNVTTNANLTGDVTSVGNATSIAAGVIVDADINASAGIVDTKLATISTASKVSNSATTATSANTASAIVARDGSGNFMAGNITADITGNVSGSSGSTTGNAATATALQTARAINGVNFDGTAAITVTAAAGTLSGTTLAAGVTASSLTSLGTIANLTATAGTVATTPTASTDIANKLYVDTVAQGLDAKASCVAATTADITLSGAQTIDGVSVVAGNRVLVKNQSLSQNNGIYLCASGSWTRTTDANTWDALTSAFTFIEQGTANGDCGFVCTANAGGTLGTTALPWSQFSGAGTFTAGTGLTLTGSVFSLTSPVAVANGGTGLTSLGSGVATFLGTPSSANLAAAVSDETGSGALVFANSPTLVTPNLGAASATSITNGLGAVGTPSYTFTGDLNTGIYSPAADTIAFVEGGAEVMRITSAGNVGIGTTNPTSLLTVNQTSGQATARMMSSTDGGCLFKFERYNSNGSFFNLETGNANRDTFEVYPDGVTGFVMTTSGNVGIGTASPAEKLSVNGNVAVTGAVSATAGYNGTVGATTPSTGAFTTLSASGVFSFTGASAFPGVLGSDGIARGYASSALGLVLYGRGSTHDVFIADRNANDILKVVAAGDTIINSANSTVLLQTASVTRAAFSSTGLEVTGTGRFTGATMTLGTGFSAAGALDVGFDGNARNGISLTDSTNTSSASFATFRKTSGAAIGSIARVTTTDAVVYNTTSDGRLKENLRDFTDSGRLIDSLKPRVFDWKNSDENGKNVVGFIAQEEHAADPIFAHIGAVSVGDDDPETITKQWQRSDSALIPILVAELQSVRQRLAALESK